MLLQEVMKSQPVSVTAEASLDHALEQMELGHFRHLPVVDDTTVVGMVSDRDLLEATGWLPARIHQSRGPQVSESLPKTVGDVMSDAVFTLAPSDTVDSVCSAIVHRSIGSVPVVEAGALVGIVTEEDLVRLYSEGAWGTRPGDGPRVSDSMSPAPKTILWSTTLGEALVLLRDEEIRHLPVLQEGQLVGILSDRDLRRAIGRGAGEDTPLDEYLTSDVVTAGPDLPLQEAARLMVRHKLGGLPVVQLDELVGILTTTDVLVRCLDLPAS